MGYLGFKLRSWADDANHENSNQKMGGYLCRPLTMGPEARGAQKKAGVQNLAPACLKLKRWMDSLQPHTLSNLPI
jgi:hypothetical protein